MTKEDQSLLFIKKPLKQPLQSASAELKKACKATRRHASAQELFARWPNLRESSERLTSLLTVYWPDNRDDASGESLLVNCLGAGFREAEKTMEEEKDDIEEQKKFIRKVSDELVECLGLTLMIKQRNGIWSAYDPSIGGYLDEVMKSSASEELTWMTKPHGAYNTINSKLVCAARVFTLNELMIAGLME